MLCFKTLFIHISTILILLQNIDCSYLCKRIPNLNSQQLRICQRSPEIIGVIRAGIQLALHECERLFRFQPPAHPSWNCSSWIRNSTNRLSVNISHDQVVGTKEAGFAYALFSAGVTFALSEACTRGNYSHCQCTNQQLESTVNAPNADNWLSYDSGAGDSNDNDWKWTGCNHNIDYGMEMARNFIDSNEHQKFTIDSLLNLHNNLMGRKLVKEEMISKCQCHGYSGSCTVKTCWRSLNMFGQVTQSLYARYKTAKKVSFNWLLGSYRNKLANRKNHRTPTIINKKVLTNRLEWLKKLEDHFLLHTELEYNQPNLDRLPVIEQRLGKIARKRDLIYMRASYSCCQYGNSTANRSKRSIGSSSALSCSINHYGCLQSQNLPHPEPCTSICCDRGDRFRRSICTQRCQCQFHFCPPFR